MSTRGAISTKLPMLIRCCTQRRESTPRKQCSPIVHIASGVNRKTSPSM